MTGQWTGRRLDMSHSGDADTLEGVIDRLLTEAAAEKTGFTDATLASIAEITDVWDPLLNGGSLIDQKSRNAGIEGGDGRDFIDAKDYHNVLEGHDDRDVLVGGLGRDTLDGGEGADVLIGGKAVIGETQDGDADVFVFRDPEAPDTVKGFESGIDTIRIDASAFARHSSVENEYSLGLSVERSLLINDGMLSEEAFAGQGEPVDAQTRIYQEGGYLYVDADGSGDHDEPVHVATLTDAAEADLIAADFQFI